MIQKNSKKHFQSKSTFQKSNLHYRLIKRGENNFSNNKSRLTSCCRCSFVETCCFKFLWSVSEPRGEVVEALTIVPPPFVTREVPMAIFGETEIELAVIETGFIGCRFCNVGDLFESVNRRWPFDCLTPPIVGVP